MSSNQKHNAVRRRRLRLADYDYSSPGGYFVTICTHRREYMFGNIANDVMHQNDFGKIVETCWSELPLHYSNADLDAFVVMPNHVHGIILLKETALPKHELAEIVRGFKTFSARRVNEHRNTSGSSVWQRGYFERIVRDEAILPKIREYILNNPLRWSFDRNNLTNFRHRTGRVSDPPLQKRQTPSRGRSQTFSSPP